MARATQGNGRKNTDQSRDFERKLLKTVKSQNSKTQGSRPLTRESLCGRAPGTLSVHRRDPAALGKTLPPPIPAREFCQTWQHCAGQKTEPSNTRGYRWNHVPPKRYGEAPSPSTSQRILIWKSGLCRRNQVNRNIPFGLPCWKPRTCHPNPGHPPWTAIRAEAGTGYQLPRGTLTRRRKLGGLTEGTSAHVVESGSWRSSCQQGLLRERARDRESAAGPPSSLMGSCLHAYEHLYPNFLFL